MTIYEHYDAYCKSKCPNYKGNKRDTSGRRRKETLIPEQVGRIVNCRRDLSLCTIINGMGNWTIDNMCPRCKNELFMLMMLEAEIGNINHAKDILLQTADRVDDYEEEE